MPPKVIVSGSEATYTIDTTGSQLTGLCTMQVLVNTNIARTITLPKLTLFNRYGVRITIADNTGDAATHNITINAASGDTINGASSVTISSNNSSIEFSNAGDSMWQSTATSGSSVLGNQQLIYLGSFNYEDVNAAPATMNYNPGFLYTIPENRLFYAFYIKTIVAFDIVADIEFAYGDISVNNTDSIITNTAYLYIGDEVVQGTQGEFKFRDTNNDTDVVNPKNFTSGECQLYIITTNSPFS